MARVLVSETNLYNIASAIRTKTGSTDEYTPEEMASAIMGITGNPNLQNKTVTQNGQVNADSGYDGLGTVTVNVPNTYSAGDEGKVVDNGTLVAQTSATFTSNGTYDTTKNDEITVNVSGGGSASLGTKTITQNGTYNASSDNLDGYSSVEVNVSGQGGSSRLPATYQEVEYVVFSGGQYCSISVQDMANKFISSKTKRTSGSSTQTIIGTNQNPNWSIYYSSGTVNQVSKYNSVDIVKQRCDSNNIIDGIYQTGGSINDIFNVGCYSSSQELFVGYVYRICAFDIDMSMIMDLVPCYRKSDNEIGFYDVVNNNFYPNEGTGTFGKGADVA